MADLIGNGWAFPLRFDAGGVKLVGGTENLARSVRLILGTRQGERPHRPTFGSRLHELMFAPTTAQTLGLAEAHVLEALRSWEPRVEVLCVRAEFEQHNTKDEVGIAVRIDFRVNETMDEGSMLYRFDTTPPEPQATA
jgi:hypothetical protein